ncbi:cytochrome c oxidase subunit 6A1, mitochondrial-like [Dromiciops gliroides]|uniref:cytochrome c oxidase subunit 6A1, mitochondrial-like n=1 Tax=Dromiciops gliroides TaxID=33562 RepID=UPI001CC640CA|nr:cytochrome c oxidase subunit 6A1, mitochondrial-like [Dromiciops gliroides]
MAVTASGRLLSPLGQVWAPGPVACLHSSSVHSKEGMNHLWRMLTFFIMLSRVVVSMLNAYLKSQDHHKLPEFIPYPHLCIQTKPFPWEDGNHTLFNNHHINPLPTSYEAE